MMTMEAEEVNPDSEEIRRNRRSTEPLKEPSTMVQVHFT